MNSTTKELRTNADIALPCPVCGAECRPDYVTELKRKKEQTAAGTVVVLPKHYLDLECVECGLQLWLTLDAAGKPITL